MGIAQESVERWQRELSNERGKREQLEDHAALLRADADRALQGEEVAKESVATLDRQLAELKAQAAKYRDEASKARLQVKEDREKLDADSQQSERVRSAGY